MKTKLFLLTLAVTLLFVPMAFTDQPAIPDRDAATTLAEPASNPVLLSASAGNCAGPGAASFGTRGPWEVTFCDNSPGHGSSKSCEEFGEDNGEFTECAADEKVHRVNCSKGNSCDQGDGNWCTCTYYCFKKTTTACTPPTAGQPLN